MSAIARVLLERGLEVSGSDRLLSPLALQLSAAGVQIFEGHSPENVRGVELVVRSSAISDQNVEVQEAYAQGIPVLKRADFLGELTAGKLGIAVAGTAGKTTTASMIAWLFTVLDQSPSFILGGVSRNLGVNARAGQGRYFVVEADEYDRMFLGLRPTIEVVTNIEHDHPDCFPTPEEFFLAFSEFVERLQPQGVLLACGEDPGSYRLARQAAGENVRTLLYGLGKFEGAKVDYLARNLEGNQSGGFDFDLYHSGDRLAHTGLQIPGVHNVLNATAALAVIDLLGLPVERAASAISEFTGAGRRFELRGEAGGVVVIDDYAHHPTKIRATLAAARARYSGRRIWAVWQPHTYSRTETLFDDFIGSFADADRVVVTEIYAAREDLRQDFSAIHLVEAMKAKNAVFAPTMEHAVNILRAGLEPGDVLIILSAGDADWISARILEYLASQRIEKQPGQPGGDR
jgi:UDP-N-acetylmuramate--alanine ligase